MPNVMGEIALLPINDCNPLLLCTSVRDVIVCLSTFWYRFRFRPKSQVNVVKVALSTLANEIATLVTQGSQLVKISLFLKDLYTRFSDSLAILFLDDDRLGRLDCSGTVPELF